MQQLKNKNDIHGNALIQPLRWNLILETSTISYWLTCKKKALYKISNQKLEKLFEPFSYKTDKMTFLSILYLS